jgi:hypothetical protein
LWWVPAHLANGLAWAFAISEVCFYLVAFEFCIGTRALPGSIRWEFYSSTITIGVLLILALWLPNVVRWIAALPLTAAVFIFILRSHRDLAKSLPTMVPQALQPRAQHLLSLIAN